MRNWINLCTLQEKIVHRDTVRRNPGDWLNTVVAINPTKSEFWSANFRQTKTGEMAESPSAAGVILKDGTVVVGEGHALSHEEICDIAGLDINQEMFRIQIHGGKVCVELWLSEDEVDNKSSTEEKIAAAVKMQKMSIDEIKTHVRNLVSRFVPGWEVRCLLWTEYSRSEEV
jgi:hypothetical protein